MLYMLVNYPMRSSCGTRSLGRRARLKSGYLYISPLRTELLWHVGTREVRISSSFFDMYYFLFWLITAECLSQNVWIFFLHSFVLAVQGPDGGFFFPTSVLIFWRVVVLAGILLHVQLEGPKLAPGWHDGNACATLQNSSFYRFSSLNLSNMS